MNKQVIILGMHRSGTSMVAGILYHLGVNMGDNLMAATQFNPLGHFEDMDFVGMNDSILANAGGNWRFTPSNKNIIATAKMLCTHTKSLIISKNKGIWGWKDPRTCLTIELYMPYLINPYFIVVQRDEDEIADSLYRRDNMDIEEGKLLCDIYTNRVQQFLKKHTELEPLFLNYNTGLQNPKMLIDDIVEFLGIQVSDEQYERAKSMVLTKEEINAFKVKNNKEIELVN